MTLALPGLEAVRRSAVLSPCGRYRYRLTREWSEAPPLVWVMLNPSTADGYQDDATIRVCCSRARRLGHGGIVVVNLFALRATDPSALYVDDDTDIVGPDIDAAIAAAVTGAPRVICAWGNHGDIMARGPLVAGQLLRRGVALYHLGLTGSGQPRHALRVPLDRALVLWGAP